MARSFVFLMASASLISSLGCASTWETVSSRRFRDKPFETMFERTDPMTVLRSAEPVAAEERARAMQALKEPTAAGYDQAAQDQVLQILSTAATQDAAPWVRLCAIDALMRFEDPRKTEILANAYHYAAGNPTPTAAAPTGGIEQAGALDRFRNAAGMGDLNAMFAGKGFSPEQISTIRCRSLDGIARTNSPEAVEFLARIADGKEFGINEDPTGKAYVRRRAVAGLTQIRSKESVVALNKVLAGELGRDTAMVNLAHEGLKDLTGQSAPADPAQWNAIVQAGYEIAPASNGVMRAIGTVVP